MDRDGSRARPGAIPRDREAVVDGALVADLGIGPGIWVFGAMLLCVTLFFKFGRFWSIRNLDLVLLFALAPGMMMLVGNRSQDSASWWAFVWPLRRFAPLAGPLPARPGPDPPPLAGAEPQRLGPGLPDRSA